MRIDPDDYNWKEAFGAVDPVNLTQGANCSIEPFTARDVSLTYGKSEGENEGASWLWIGQLKDGRFAFISAWCDFTGWDCRAGGHSFVADDLSLLVWHGIGDEERERLNITDLVLLGLAGEEDERH